MADFVEVNVDGLDELEERIQKLSHSVARKVMREALQAAGDVYLKAELERVPVAADGHNIPKGHEPGTLSDSLIVKVTLSESKESGAVEVGPSKDGWYGKFSEFGTSHEPARPWMRPAFDSCAEETQQAFVDKLREGVDRAFNEMGEPKK